MSSVETALGKPGRLRVVIADDEPPARQRLRQLLAGDPGVEIVAECATGREVVAAAENQGPDVVLLDIRMPDLDGPAAAGLLRRHGARPAIIFVTAYDTHASDAFDLRACDYLLKPCTPARLKLALQRARELLAVDPGRSEPERRRPLQRVVIRSGDRMAVVAAEDIDWVESANNYVVLHVGGATHVLRETLTELEARLDPRLFLRISRFAGVNPRRVREILMAENGGHVCRLADGARLPITRGIREIQALLESC